MTTRMSVVELSSGSVWNPNPSEAPYLVAQIGAPWPVDADCSVVFTDTSGGVLNTLYADSVTADAIRFIGDPSDVDSIPAGANFEIFIDTDDGPSKIRYGKVIRREVEFPDAAATQTSFVALNYTDTFPTLGLRSNWVAVKGKTKVYSNAGVSQPNGVSANSGLFVAKSAIRWDTPLNSDTVKSRAVLLNQGPGRCTIIVCADQRFTSGLAVDFNSSTNKLNVGIITSPTDIAAQVSQISHTVVDLADYTVSFNLLSKTLAVYKGTDTTPLLSWTDSSNVVPHGPGYRYAGFSFDTGLIFSPGIEVSSWQAKDD